MAWRGWGQYHSHPCRTPVPHYASQQPRSTALSLQPSPQPPFTPIHHPSLHSPHPSAPPAAVPSPASRGTPQRHGCWARPAPPGCPWPRPAWAGASGIAPRRNGCGAGACRASSPTPPVRCGGCRPRSSIAGRTCTGSGAGSRCSCCSSRTWCPWRSSGGTAAVVGGRVRVRVAVRVWVRVGMKVVVACNGCGWRRGTIVAVQGGVVGLPPVRTSTRHGSDRERQVGCEGWEWMCGAWISRSKRSCALLGCPNAMDTR